MAKKKPASQKPDWTKHQQKQTGSQTRKEQVDKSQETAKVSTVKVFMNTDYRDVVKKGQVFETDAQKADELIRLKRAVKYDAKEHKKATVVK